MNAAADTTAAPQASGRLSDDQVREVLRLIKGANSVELKLTVPATAHRATIQGLPMDPVEAQPRQVYFFDTPDLQLYRAGVVVRARRIQGGRGDTVVKLRPVEPDDIPADLKNDSSFNIEVDALPGGFVCSASYKGRSTGQDIRSAVGGKKKLSKIFSKQQRAFYREHAPAGVNLDELVALGPTFILKGRFDVQTGLDADRPRSMVAEVWLYPDGSRLLELSTKCLPKEALAVAAETRAYLTENGVPTTAAQETKTRTALEFYSKALAAEMASTAKAADKPLPAKRTVGKPAPAKAAAKAATTAKAATAKVASAAKAAATKATSGRSAGNNGTSAIPSRKSAASLNGRSKATPTTRRAPATSA
jgi:hypothetical protein